MRRYPLSKHRESQFEWANMFFVTAIIFWIASQLSDKAMSTEFYGEMVAAIPAELWAGLVLLASSTHMIGLTINGRWRWSPVVRLFGAGTNLILFVLFAVSSTSATIGTSLSIVGTAVTFNVITIFSSVFSIWAARYFVYGLEDFRRALKG